ncbi:hypothetical protein Glove_22g210 [Diversispora epigaea]|uniref:Uncharacterized protein n=1 Tax=Diversispora epigaea TaxID=1348612 RepID=A0A397JW01_9GLOM|nr:hypothetical protein Glove_22g210 [Diversispora epigaea]
MSSGDNKIIEDLVQISEKDTQTIPSISQENLTKEVPQQNPDNSSPKQASTNYVVQISTDPKSELSVWNNEYNLMRKFSMPEDDVCFPIQANDKHEGIDYDELEKCMNELCSTDKEEGQHLSPLSLSSGNLLSRRVSQFSERTKSAEITEEYRYIFYSSLIGTIRAKKFTDIVKNVPDKIENVPSKGITMTELLKKGYFWIDVLSPTESEMRMISKIFQIHPLTMEDIETEETREKCELFKNYYFISFGTYDQTDYQPGEIEPVNMYNIVMREGILSFHFQQTPHQLNVRNRIRQLKDYITVTPDWINYAIIDEITDSFAPLIRKVEFESDAIDQLVLVLKKSEQQDMLVRIGLCRKLGMSLLRMLQPKADVIKALIKRCEERLVATSSEKSGPGDVNLYLGDIQDHIIMMLQNLNHYEKILSRAQSNYLAQISVEITQLSNQTNDIINKLTMFASILLPLNVVTGLFGMNVHVPGQDEETFGYFIGICGSFAIIVIFGYIFAKRVKVF